jgi:hypothetical protein
VRESETAGDVPFDDADDEARAAEEAEEAADDGLAEAGLGEADDGLDGAELDAERDPADAAEEDALVVVAAALLDAALADERLHEAVEREQEADGLVGRDEREREAAEERPRRLGRLRGEDDGDGRRAVEGGRIGACGGSTDAWDGAGAGGLRYEMPMKELSSFMRMTVGMKMMRRNLAIRWNRLGRSGMTSDERKKKRKRV